MSFERAIRIPYAAFFARAGVWLITANEAVGTATAVFLLGIVLMFCSSTGLLGLVRRSWAILGMLVVVLLAVLFALFGVMTICFVLGYRMPSLRDIVTDSWQKGCVDPALDTQGCMQVELIAQNWCWDHAGLAVPAPGGEGADMFEAGDTDPLCAKNPEENTETDDASQRTHACSVACQLAMVATLEDKMGWIAIGCYIAFFVLVFVVMWNSQTHHGLWCIKASPHDDDDENTVMSIPPLMAYGAYFLNGVLGIAGVSLAVSAGVMLTSPTSFTAAFAIFLGLYYFVLSAVSCGAVAKNLHWLLRVCNILYFASCLPLLILSLVAAVYSGKIENVYDSYDDNWCKVRNDLDILNPDYCMAGQSKLSDAACKAKIVEDTSAHLRLVGYACLFSLLAVSLLIWFSMRLSRKFKFDARDTVEGSSDDVEYYEDDDKGGDDDAGDAGEADGGKGIKDPVQMGLLGAPVFFSLVAIGLVFGLGGDALTAPTDCDDLRGVTGKFNGTGVWGEIRFTQKAREDGVALEIEYQADESVYTTEILQSAITHYEIHEFPVPEDGDCSQLGGIFPSDQAGKFGEQIGAMTADLNSPLVELLVETTGLEQLYYDGEIPEPVNWVDGGASEPAVQLFGERAITGRSVLLTGPGMCVPTDAQTDAAVCNELYVAANSDAANRAACEDAQCFYIPTNVACGDITAPGMQVATANFTDASGFLDSKIRGSFRFSQVTVRGSESDTVVYIELEATENWDESAYDAAACDPWSPDCPDGTPEQNGCDDTPGKEAAYHASCGHSAHVHYRHLGNTAPARTTPDAAHLMLICGSAGQHFNGSPVDPTFDPAACGACEQTFTFTDHLPSTADAPNPYDCRQTGCETGDLSGMYGKLNIGKPGQPKKYLFVNKFDSHCLKIASTGQVGTDALTNRAVVLHTSQGAEASGWPFMDDPSGNGNRMACANVPLSSPFASTVG
eukprot:COSAG02_NODE_4348_length_5467_cov_6.159806_2_plen_957_part_00